MAYEIIDWKNKGETGAKPINRDNLRHMDNGILNLDTYKAEIMPLLTVSDTAPVECERGDLYYNTTTELIYVATQPDTWSEEGTTPSIFNLYVDLSSSKLYYYDGTNFNSYGSGGGGETLPVGTELDFDGVSQDIPTGWEEVNNPDSYSTTEIKTNKTWINGEPIYRKVIRKDTATSAGANPNISTGVTFSLIGEITELKVLGKQSNSNTWFVASSNLSGQEVFGCYLSENNISIRNYWALEKIICILEYTKTTD